MIQTPIRPEWMPDPEDVKSVARYYTAPHPWERPVWSDGGLIRCPYDGSILEIHVWADYSGGGFSAPEPAYAGICLICNHEMDL